MINGHFNSITLKILFFISILNFQHSLASECTEKCDAMGRFLFGYINMTFCATDGLSHVNVSHVLFTERGSLCYFLRCDVVIIFCRNYFRWWMRGEKMEEK